MRRARPPRRRTDSHPGPDQLCVPPPSVGRLADTPPIRRSQNPADQGRAAAAYIARRGSSWPG